MGILITSIYYYRDKDTKEKFYSSSIRWILYPSPNTSLALDTIKNAFISSSFTISLAVTHVEIKNGDRILGDYEEGVMVDFKLTEEDIDFLCNHDLVVTGIWGMIKAELHKIKERGVPVAFDFADKPDHEITHKALPYVDYAFFSNDSKSDEGLHEFMKFIKSKGPSVVVVTRGEKGSIAYDGNEFTKFGIIECEVIDSMGAGDSYIAGFLMGK